MPRTTHSSLRSRASNPRDGSKPYSRNVSTLNRRVQTIPPADSFINLSPEMELDRNERSPSSALHDEAPALWGLTSVDLCIMFPGEDLLVLRNAWKFDDGRMTKTLLKKRIEETIRIYLAHRKHTPRLPARDKESIHRPQTLREDYGVHLATELWGLRYSTKYDAWLVQASLDFAKGESGTGRTKSVMLKWGGPAADATVGARGVWLTKFEAARKRLGLHGQRNS